MGIFARQVETFWGTPAVDMGIFAGELARSMPAAGNLLLQALKAPWAAPQGRSHGLGSHVLAAARRPVPQTLSQFEPRPGRGSPNLLTDNRFGF